MAKNTTKIEDFGEKIGGARKDLATKGYSLRGTDIHEWSKEEREQYVTKATLFKKPDYMALVKGGMMRETAFFIKTLYDSLPARPARPTEESQSAYVDFISYFRDKINDISYKAQAEDFFQKSVVDSQYVETQDAGWHKQYAITDDTYKAVQSKDFSRFFRAAQYRQYDLERRVKAQKFCYSDEEKITADYRFILFDGSNVIADNDVYSGKPHLVYKFGPNLCNKCYYYADNDLSDLSQWSANTWVAIDAKRNIIGINYSSKEEAINDILSQQENDRKNNPQAGTRKSALLPPQLEHIERIGQDYREGTDISGDNMLDTFSFRGGEFGNWENQNDRQANLNMAYEAFKDLAKALNIADEDVSLGGRLAMAWGSRGHGKAMAHYERAGNVINLTKLKGAGSLAHEWGHALDNFIGKAISDEFVCEMATDTAFSTSSPIYDVMQKIKYRFDVKTNTMCETDFFKDAMSLDKKYSSTGNQKSNGKSGYWHSNVELFARAFSTYVLDKLAPEGKNDYLCGHAEMIPMICPHGEERKEINAAFDRLFDNLRERGLVHQRTEQDNHKLIGVDYVTQTEIVPEPAEPVALNVTKIGDFYEFYGKDAELAAEALDITLTPKNGEPMSGIPAHAFDNYTKILEEKGYNLTVNEAAPEQTVVIKQAAMKEPPAFPDVGEYEQLTLFDMYDMQEKKQRSQSTHIDR